MNDIFDRKLIRVPVKIKDGKAEYFNGGSIPARDDTIADLVLSESAITDKTFLKLVTHKTKHKIFDEGTELLVALTIKAKPTLDDLLVKHLMNIGHPEIVLGSSYFYKFRSADTKFVKIAIDKPTDKQNKLAPDDEGGMWLDIQGLQAKGISSSTIKLPDGVVNEIAISLNHAFTMLSEKYEPWRRSHTGNIYDRLLYKEKNGKWYPIDLLRNNTLIQAEHQFAKEQWIIIADRLKQEKV